MENPTFQEHELEVISSTALEQHQFVVYYQPQYNHAASLLVGAEALVRWNHPEKGLIPPNEFIPRFEENGFVTQLDAYVFEQVCIFLKKCLDAGIPTVPISINLSRQDVFYPGFIQSLEGIRQTYDVPADKLHLEITETSASGSTEYINNVIEKLHGFGYVVEMDDFGSGYSSLNVLKDMDFDIIKLDLEFLRDEHGHSERGGIILSSVVRMIHWLQMPIIAEGVETPAQADFLRSIGCYYVQGYLYGRPMPEAEFVVLLQGDHIGRIAPELNLIDAIDAEKFWDNESLETLIFSNYVGGAAIFEYEQGKTEILRVNQKYLKELGMNLLEKDLIGKDVLDFIEADNRDVFIRMLERAIASNDEEECQTWRCLHSDFCGDEMLYIRTTARVVGRSNNRCIFYAMIRNITAEMEEFQALSESERKLRGASEQANIYCWEYTIATKEMRPCFRCIRDLGLPPLLKNYPESAIEAGVFPPEEADMYRELMHEIDNGIPSIDVVMTLTADRIPFHVRYTTEFDENGFPVKAIGSATQVVDNVL